MKTLSTNSPIYIPNCDKPSRSQHCTVKYVKEIPTMELKIETMREQK